MAEEETHLSEEPGGEITEQDGFVRLLVVGRGWDCGEVPEVRLPLVEAVSDAARVEKEDLRCALNEPSAVHELDASFAHGGEHRGEGGSE